MTSFPQLDALRGGNGIIRLLGHRGARGVMPENTMEGFAFTTAIGVRALEFDVVLTQDAVPVITHNHTLLASATRDATGHWIKGGAEPKVSEMTYAALAQMDVGGLDSASVYGQRFPDQAFLYGVRVPRLSDLLKYAAAPEQQDLCLLLELKSDPDVSDAAAARHRVVTAVVSGVREAGMGPRTIMHSFDWQLLDECRRQAPDMPTSYLSQLPKAAVDLGEESSKPVGPDYAALQVSVPQAVKDAGGQVWSPHYSDVTPDLVAEAQALNLPVLAWTVNDLPDIQRMIDAGVDGLITDYPGRVQHCLLARGLRWQDTF